MKAKQRVQWVKKAATIRFIFHDFPGSELRPVDRMAFEPSPNWLDHRVGIGHWKMYKTVYQ